MMGKYDSARGDLVQDRFRQWQLPRVVASAGGPGAPPMTLGGKATLSNSSPESTQ